MTADTVAQALVALLLAALVTGMPALTRPTVPFGVRVPADRAGDPVVRRERRAYHWRAGILTGALVAVALLLPPGWAGRAVVVLPAQLAAGLACLLLARRRVLAAKAAQGWFDGLSQRVTADTSWRTDPEPFPVRWLAPALAVIAVTVVVGVVRYPHLPARLAVHFGADGTADRWAARSFWTASGPVITQLTLTLLSVGVLVLAYRARPEVDAADVAGSVRRYRAFLSRTARALLVLIAAADVTVLLAALQTWQVWHLTGSGAAALPALPVLAGMVVVVAVAVRTGQAGARLAAGAPSGAGSDGVTDRDDDRFWKAGLFYLNRDDPALLVGKRFGVGWTVNFGNPKALAAVAGFVLLVVAFPLAAALTRR